MNAPSKNRAAVALGRKGGRIGGRVTSPAKAAAARANGARGGRPRKDAATYADLTIKMGSVCQCGHVRARHITGLECMAYALTPRACECNQFKAKA